MKNKSNFQECFLIGDLGEGGGLGIVFQAEILEKPQLRAPWVPSGARDRRSPCSEHRAQMCCQRVHDESHLGKVRPGCSAAVEPLGGSPGPIAEGGGSDEYAQLAEPKVTERNQMSARLDSPNVLTQDGLCLECWTTVSVIMWFISGAFTTRYVEASGSYFLSHFG